MFVSAGETNVKCRNKPGNKKALAKLDKTTAGRWQAGSMRIKAVKGGPPNVPSKYTCGAAGIYVEISGVVDPEKAPAHGCCVIS